MDAINSSEFFSPGKRYEVMWIENFQQGAFQ